VWVKMGQSTWQIVQLLPLAFIALAGCTQALDSTNGTSNAAQAPADFGKSTLSVGSSAPADGSSLLTVAVKLLNLDGSAVVNYTPTFSVAPSSGLTAQACTVTDSNGLSTCTMKSVVAGAKNFYLTQPQTGLNTQIVFTVPNGVQNTIASAGGLVGQTTDGYSVRMSLGGTLQGFNSMTRDGYKLNFFLKSANTQ